jgi:putative transposase
VCQLGWHLVWCPKYRRRVLGGRHIVVREVMPDRVHLPVRVGPADAPGAAVRAFTHHTARLLPHEFSQHGRFAKVLWSSSYFAASVGYVSESTMRSHIGHRWDAVAS